MSGTVTSAPTVSTQSLKKKRLSTTSATSTPGEQEDEDEKHPPFHVDEVIKSNELGECIGIDHKKRRCYKKLKVASGFSVYSGEWLDGKQVAFTRVSARGQKILIMFTESTTDATGIMPRHVTKSSVYKKLGKHWDGLFDLIVKKHKIKTDASTDATPASTDSTPASTGSTPDSTGSTPDSTGP